MTNNLNLVNGAASLEASLHRLGFAIIDKPATLCTDAALRQQEQIFELSEIEKKQMVCASGFAITGYVAYGLERAATHFEPDPKELWHISRDPDQSVLSPERFLPNIWPAQIPEFKTVFKTFFGELDSLAVQLVSSIFSTFDAAHLVEPMLVDHNSVLRLAHYRPRASDDHLAREHVDVNLITIHAFQSSPGFQVLVDGQWTDITWGPDQLLVSVGSMLTHLTNGLLPACRHRVINPMPTVGKSRYYAGYFVHPSHDTVLRCFSGINGPPRFADIHNLDLINQRGKELQIFDKKNLIV